MTAVHTRLWDCCRRGQIQRSLRVVYLSVIVCMLASGFYRFGSCNLSQIRPQPIMSEMFCQLVSHSVRLPDNNHPDLLLKCLVKYCLCFSRVSSSFVTIGTPVITNWTRNLNISSAEDVQVSGPVGYDRCSYCNTFYRT